MTKALVPILLALLLPGWLAASPAFAIRVAEGLLDEPYTGRVYVQVVPAEQGGPEEPRLANRWFDPPWLFTRDVEAWDGSRLVLADLPEDRCFPDVPSALPEGRYRVQAFLRLDRFSPDPGRGAADLVGPTEVVDLGEGVDPVVELLVDHHPAVDPPVETERVKWFERTSESLSAFHGFDYPMQAGVVLPRDWAPDRSGDFPVLVYIGGFGDDHVRGAALFTDYFKMFYDAVVVVPNPLNYRGHSVFVDSDSIGPWGTALVTELLPAIDRRFGLAGPSKRYVTGISSGGWSSLWLQIRWPDEFRHAWGLVPDPVDFRDFQGVDIYREGDSFYVNRDGSRRPLARGMELWYDDFVRHEDVMGPGLQIHSFEATFSPRGPDGAPVPLFDRRSGLVNPEVAEAFRRFDLSEVLRERWGELGPSLAGKLTVVAGGEDTFLLDGAARRLQETVGDLGAAVDVRVIEGMGHQPHRPTLHEMARRMAEDGGMLALADADDTAKDLHAEAGRVMGGGVDRWFLIVATLLAAVGGVVGMLSLRHRRRSRWTLVLMIGAFLAQLGFLWLRGQERAACPLIGLGEILAFLAWSLTLFYLAVGPAYRISLLGVFSAPVVVVFQAVALMPGVLEADPQSKPVTDAWGETHAAMSVLGYGALALAAVAGVMFLVLDRQLKEHHLNSGLFRHLPPVRELLVSLQRLMWLGMAMLTVGVVAGFLMHRDGGTGHLVAASGVWLAYAVLLGVKQVRGMTGRRFSLGAVVLFVLSLSVFAFV